MDVVALKYNVTYSQFFVPIVEIESSVETDAFSIRVDGDVARVLLRVPISSVNDARSVVEPFLRAWEIEAGLVRGYPMLSFSFAGSEIEGDGVVHAALDASFDALLAFELAELPQPPTAAQPSVWSDVMWRQFSRYREGTQALTATAYACLTIAEASAPRGRGQRRSRAAAHYGLKEADLGRLGKLTNVGDPTHGRKYTGTAGELSNDELVWIEMMLIKIVRAVCRTE